jgi:hypothetical protein
MFHFFTKKIVARFVVPILILAVIIPACYTQPKKAEAGFSDCIATLAADLGISLAAGTIAAPLSVPVSDNGKTYSASVQAGGGMQDFMHFCIEEGIAIPIGKYLLSQMTQSMITWINSGFSAGGPAFIQNPEQFFENVANQEAGTLIGSLVPLLCSPFNAQIRLALALNFGNSGATTAKCTLTSIMSNVQHDINSFMNNFNSWGDFLSITTNSNNNTLGSYMNAAGSINLDIANKQNTQAKQLNWGNGFFSYEVCSDGTSGNSFLNGTKKNQVTTVNNQANGTVISNQNQANAANNTTAPANQPVNCNITTPGGVIASTLNHQLGIPADQLGVADDLDKIFNALGYELLKMGIQGVIGLGNGGISGATNNNGSNLLAQVTSQAQQDAGTAGNAANTGINGINSEQQNQNNPNTPVNIAQGDTVTEGPGVAVDSTGALDEASRLTDGGTDSQDGDSPGYVGAQTTNGAYPSNPAFMPIDLGKTEPDINSVSIYERTNPGAAMSRNVQYVVQILDSSGNPVWTSPSITQDYSGLKIMPVPNISGEFVKIEAITNGALALRQVEVFLRHPPTIVLNGANPYMLDSTSSPYVDPGFTATDQDGNTITSPGQTGTMTATVALGTSTDSNGTTIPPGSPLSSINTSDTGTYTIVYNATDGAGLSAPTVTRTVIIQNISAATAPIITLVGLGEDPNAPLTVPINGTYVDPGYSAVDENGNSLTAEVQVSVNGVLNGTVNTSAAGTTTIAYNVSDANGVPAKTVTRTVLVQ